VKNLKLPSVSTNNSLKVLKVLKVLKINRYFKNKIIEMALRFRVRVNTQFNAKAYKMEKITNAADPLRTKTVTVDMENLNNVKHEVNKKQLVLTYNAAGYNKLKDDVTVEYYPLATPDGRSVLHSHYVMLTLLYLH